jgi:hypothetical protein
VWLPLGVGVERRIGNFGGHAGSASGARNKALPDGIIGDGDDDPPIGRLERIVGRDKLIPVCCVLYEWDVVNNSKAG